MWDDDSAIMESCIASVLEEGRYDWIMGAELASIIMEISGTKSPGVVRSLALSVIGALLSRGLAEIGDVLAGRGFVPWGGDSGANLDRASREWPAVRTPGLGEGGWLRVLSDGRA